MYAAHGRNGSWPPALGSTKSTPPVVAVAAAAIPSVRASGLTPALVHPRESWYAEMAQRLHQLVPRRVGKFTSGVHARFTLRGPTGMLILSPLSDEARRTNYTVLLSPNSEKVMMGCPTFDSQWSSKR